VLLVGRDNAGTDGANVMVVEALHPSCNISDTNNHIMQGLCIYSIAGFGCTKDGSIMVISQPSTYTGKGKNVHLAMQPEHLGGQAS
jgi:hypothetical protein